MLPDPTKPVGGIARVGLAAMSDAVPVGGEGTLPQVVGLLGGFVAGVPEIVNLEQAGGQSQPEAVRGAGEEAGPGGLGERR